VTNLAVCRMLFFGAMFLHYLPEDIAAWADVSHVFWTPIWFFERLHIAVVSKGVLATMQSLWLVALAFCCVGLMTLVMTVIALVLGVYVLGLPNNFGAAYHDDTLVIVVLGIMAMSRCGDGWSIDSLIRTASDPCAIRRAHKSAEYKWPVQLVCV